MHPRNLTGARVTVMGLGRFGGGAGVTRWLCNQGAKVLLTDLDPAEKLTASLAELHDLIDSGAVTLRLAGHQPEDFTSADLVVANPAVPKPWDNQFLRAAHAARVPVTTEIRLLCERLPDRARVIGITGSAGKSTTSAMIAHILRQAMGNDRVHFGGNIGGSLLPHLASMRATDAVVLELSSAQLYWLGASVGYPDAPAWTPRVAVITNISPNHLDWHADFDHYARSKLRILESHSHNDTAILGPGVDPFASSPDPYRGRCHTKCDGGGRTIHPINPALAQNLTLRIPGHHNRINAAAAIQACAEVGVSHDDARTALASFTGLPHRLELVADQPTFRAYNDSKCTTPEACALAIAAFEAPGEVGASRVRLICGGYDKKINLGPMIDAAARCAAVYTIGATGPELARRVNAAAGSAHNCTTLETAIDRAMHDAESEPWVLLLSPGCASWDQFTNYEQRGERFAQLVERGLASSPDPDRGRCHSRSE